MSKPAHTDHPIHLLLVDRWSPYGFAPKAVAVEDIRSLFEAARWAPSSYNEQPWSYLVATKDDEEGFAKLLSCLLEGNQSWAKDVPVLAISVASTKFARNGKPNKAAFHDLGLAAAQLTFEATARGLAVHQMIGIDPDRARELYGLPEDVEAFTGLAIGYPADASALPEKLRERDAAPRSRKPLGDFLYGSGWGVRAPILDD